MWFIIASSIADKRKHTHTYMCVHIHIRSAHIHTHAHSQISKHLFASEMRAQLGAQRDSHSEIPGSESPRRQVMTHSLLEPWTSNSCHPLFLLLDRALFPLSFLRDTIRSFSRSGRFSPQTGTLLRAAFQKYEHFFVAFHHIRLAGRYGEMRRN